MSSKYLLSPWGTAEHPWLSKADTKYNEGGVFKTGLSLGGPEALKFKEEVDREAKAALERFWESDAGKKVPQKERKLWKTYSPLKVDTDDDANPTGYVVFNFKQNQTLKLKDGTVKVIKIGVKDVSGKKDVTKPVFGGSELRIMYTYRDVVLTKDKSVGVQLAFAQVQVRKLAELSGGVSFDDAGEGYREGQEQDGDQGPAGASSDKDTGGDY